MDEAEYIDDIVLSDLKDKKVARFQYLAGWYRDAVPAVTNVVDANASHRRLLPVDGRFIGCFRNILHGPDEKYRVSLSCAIAEGRSRIVENVDKLRFRRGGEAKVSHWPGFG